MEVGEGECELNWGWGGGEGVGGCELEWGAWIREYRGVGIGRMCASWNGEGDVMGRGDVSWNEC